MATVKKIAVKPNPAKAALKNAVSGAIARGEAKAIVGKPAKVATPAKTAKHPAIKSITSTDHKTTEIKKVAPKPDAIKSVKGSTNGSHVVVSTGGDSVDIRSGAFKGELTKLAVIGASFKAVQAYLKANKPEAKLATGLDGRSAPQSAEAAAKSQKAGKAPAPTATATAGGGSASKKGASPAKASAGAKLGMKTDFAYRIGGDNSTRPDTWTHHMVRIAQGKGDTAAARAAHEKSGHYAGKKLDFAWMLAKGFIVKA